MGGSGGSGGEFVDEATASYEYLIKMKATNEEMERERVPIQWRDQCAHRLIPLNQCRVKNFYLPWHCTELRHAYEKCQYFLILARMWQAHLRENVAPAPLQEPKTAPLDGVIHQSQS